MSFMYCIGMHPNFVEVQSKVKLSNNEPAPPERGILQERLY